MNVPAVVLADERLLDEPGDVPPAGPRPAPAAV
jgi:hypothetical protein